MTSLHARIRDDLAEAMRDRDMARVKVLRTTMSAIQNAEAVEGVASVEGVVGYSDVQRRSLSDDDVIEIIVPRDRGVRGIRCGIPADRPDGEGGWIAEGARGAAELPQPLTDPALEPATAA